MKRLLIALFFALSAAAQTPGTRSVYILPMAGGFDQYLAEQIAREHVMQVVADPKTADTVLTDRLGEAFEANLTKLRPPAQKDRKDGPETHPSFQFSGHRGTIFLVDAASRRVLWSDYQKMSPSSTARVMNREAASVTKKLAAFANPAPASH